MKMVKVNLIIMQDKNIDEVKFSRQDHLTQLKTLSEKLKKK